MAHKETLYTASVKINRIADLSDFNNHSVIRVPIRTKAEANELLSAGVAIYEKIIESPYGGLHKRYYCEVLLGDLCKIALK